VAALDGDHRVSTVHTQMSGSNEMWVFNTNKRDYVAQQVALHVLRALDD
jgi:hypothetical protein